jgi:hypothetical protein
MTEPEQTDSQADATLRERRPRPARDFGDRLRARLMELDAGARRPPRLWLLVVAYVCSGAVLLLLAALSASGGGPFGS